MLNFRRGITLNNHQTATKTAFISCSILGSSRPNTRAKKSNDVLIGMNEVMVASSRATDQISASIIVTDASIGVSGCTIKISIVRRIYG